MKVFSCIKIVLAASCVYLFRGGHCDVTKTLKSGSFSPGKVDGCSISAGGVPGMCSSGKLYLQKVHLSCLNGIRLSF